MKRADFAKMLRKQAVICRKFDKNLLPYVDDKLSCLDYYCSRRYDTKPNKFKGSAEKLGETSLQRVIKERTISHLSLPGSKAPVEVSWADIELPVVFGPQKRRPSVDLVGIRGEKPFLCEVKYQSPTNRNPDSPLFAIAELIFYYYVVKYCNAIELDVQDVHHNNKNCKAFKWENISNFLLILANDRYWHSWLEQNDMASQIKRLVDVLNEEIKVDIQLCKTGEITEIKPFKLCEPNAVWKSIFS
ncbi:MAG: hypothetical protein ACYC7L_17145 [Nitrospirota bacterium]